MTSILPATATADQPNLQDSQAPLDVHFWLLLVLVGLAAGVAGGLLMRLLHLAEASSFPATGEFLAKVQASSGRRRIVVLFLAGLVAGAAGWVAALLNGETGLNGAVLERSGRMPIAKSTIKALYSIVVVGMGAAVGRENALKQAGAVLANIASSWRRVPDEQRRLLVACGAGAGMAAAYNVPLGGALFTLEILLGSFSLRSALPAFAASMLATWASWLFLPDRPTYAFSASTATPSLIAWAVVAGPLCGLAAVPYIRLLGWARSVKPGSWRRVALPILTLTLLGLAAVRVPAMLGNGKDVVELTLRNSAATSLLVVLLVFRPLATAAVLRSGVPGGVFTPTLCFGGVAGLLLGRGWAALLPQSAAPGQLPSFALIGAGAMLAAATKGPVSSLVFVLELTRTADAAMVPLLIAVVSATLACKLFEERSIYSIE